MAVQAAVLERRPVILPALAINAFGKYNPEAERTVRNMGVKEDARMAQLKEAWGQFELRFAPCIQTPYKSALEVVNGLNATSKEVEQFSILLPQLPADKKFSEKAGLFLSAMINSGKDSDYTVHTSHLERELEHLGNKNVKNIIVKGDAGRWSFFQMSGGSVTVEGNAGYMAAACIRGGIITVEGNVDECLGNHMEGGKIIVKGNAGAEVCGTGMLGGEIHVYGDIESIHNFKKGKIYHKGKCIRAGY